MNSTGALTVQEGALNLRRLYDSHGWRKYWHCMEQVAVQMLNSRSVELESREVRKPGLAKHPEIF
jgi:hypothetical protein